MLQLLLPRPSSPTQLPPAAQAPLASGTLAKVAILVLKPDRTPAERFVFEPQVHLGRNRCHEKLRPGVGRPTSPLPVCICRCIRSRSTSRCAPLRTGHHPPPPSLALQILSGASAGGGQEAALDVDAVQAQLRGVLLKLQYADALLRKLPPGCSFEVVAYTTAGRGGVGDVPLDAWVEEQAAPGGLELRQVRCGGAAAGAARPCLPCLVWLLCPATGETACGLHVLMHATARPWLARRPKSCRSNRAGWRARSSCNSTARARASVSLGMATSAVLAHRAPAAQRVGGSGTSDLDAADIDAELAAALASDLSGSGSDDDGELGGGSEGASTELSLVGEGLVAVPPDLAARCPTLRRLCLHGNSITSVAGLGGLAALRDLNLSSNSISHLPDGALAGLSSLTALSLASNRLAVLGGAALAGLPRLRRLTLAHNSLVSLAGLAALYGGPLEQVDVRDNALASLAEFSVLAGVPRLAELRVACGLPGAGRQRAREVRRLLWLGSFLRLSPPAHLLPLLPVLRRQPRVPPAAVPCSPGCGAAAPAAAGWAAGEPWGGHAVPGCPAPAGLPAPSTSGRASG